MRKTTFILGAVTLSLVMAGVAYAHWMELITVDGFVQTGSLEVCWVDVGSHDPSTMKDPVLEVTSWGGEFGVPGSESFWDTWPLEGEFVRESKHVAKTSIEYIDCNTAEVKFRNVYPMYAPLIQLRFEGMGTVPAHAETMVFEYDHDGDPTTPEFIYGLFDHDGDPGTPEIMLSGEEAMDIQGGMELYGWWITKKEGGSMEVIYGATKGVITNPIIIPGVELTVTDENMGIFLFEEFCAYVMGSDDVPQPEGAPGVWEFGGLQVHEGDNLGIHMMFLLQEHTQENKPCVPDPEFGFNIHFDWINYNEDGSFIMGMPVSP